MQTVEVETINPHQYRQQDRIVGEKYQAESIHLPLLILAKWVKPIQAEIKTGVVKIKDKHRLVRS
jgi:hypothetical protein